MYPYKKDPAERPWLQALVIAVTIALLVASGMLALGGYKGFNPLKSTPTSCDINCGER